MRCCGRSKDYQGEFKLVCRRTTSTFEGSGRAERIVFDRAQCYLQTHRAGSEWQALCPASAARSQPTPPAGVPAGPRRCSVFEPLPGDELERWGA